MIHVKNIKMITQEMHEKKFLMKGTIRKWWSDKILLKLIFKLFFFVKCAMLCVCECMRARCLWTLKFCFYVSRFLFHLKSIVQLS